MAETKIGKYTITGELGKGAMGIVYKGVDPYIGRTLAIKTIRFDIMGQPSAQEEAQKRFMREARSAGILSHPNIVTIYEVGEDAGTTYIAMEYIEGQSLEEIMASGRQFSPEEVTNIVEQIGSALDYAHKKGITHRDIKPGNILVDSEGTAHIVDFGIARIATSTMTQTSMVMGTPSYMSPEQIAGKKVDGRSDIFSLGTIMYELLTNEKPFPGENLTTIVYKIMNETPPPPRVLSPEISEDLEIVVKKALAKNPRERYQSCKELLDDLRSLHPSAGTPISSERSVPETIPHAGEQLSAMAIEQEEILPQVQPQLKKNRKPLLIVLGSMMGILIVILAVVFLTMGKSEKSGINIPVSADKPVEKIQPSAPLNTQADYELAAQEAFSARDVNKLEKILEDGMRQYNNSSKLWVYKAGYYSLVSQDPQSNENAQGAATTAVNLDQSNLDNYYELGQIFQNIMKDYSIAFDYYQKGETKGLIRDDLSYHMALCSENLRDSKSAIAYYERFLKATPAHNLAADAQTRLAALKKPKKKKIIPAKTQIAYEKAIWDKVLNEKFKEIEKDVEEGLKFYPNSSRLWAYKAINIFAKESDEAKDIDEAMEAANKALKLNQTDPQIYIVLKVLYEAKGNSSRYDEIEKAYALKHPELYFEIAKTYEEVKEKKAAIDYYDRFLKASPSHRFAGDARKRLTKLNPDPPVIKSVFDIPILSANVSELKFYEKGESTIPKEQRKYGKRFAKSESRYIRWELNLTHPAPARRIDFTIEAVWYKSDGSVLIRQTNPTFLEADWKNSWHAKGWGWKVPGNWEPGNYRVDLIVEGKKVASGSFEIYQEKKRPAATDTIPSLNATVTEVKFYEGGTNGVAYKQRVYSNRFASNNSRFVFWELHLKHPAPGRRVDFKVDAVWYNPDGSVFSRQTKSTYLEPDWKTSWHVYGSGWEKPGNWKPGNYRVDLFVKGKIIASASFAINR
ncbi:protein kinase [Acidobacteriota bacterium]